MTFLMTQDLTNYVYTPEEANVLEHFGFLLIRNNVNETNSRYKTDPQGLHKQVGRYSLGQEIIFWTMGLITVFTNNVLRTNVVELKLLVRIHSHIKLVMSQF
jgi:hypothetical protein